MALANPLRTLGLMSALALGTTACGTDTDTESYDMAAADNVVVADVVPIWTVTLTPEQQQRRDALDMVGYQQDVRGYQDEMRRGTGNGGTSDETGTDTTASNSSATAGGNSSVASQPASQMQFEELDRDDSGSLSVAEFAIYAVGLDPTVPKANDETMPYASQGQLNNAADSFFYYDSNGDTYLQREEFEAAKSAARL